MSEETHLDILGRPLNVGSPVAVGTANSGLKICTVKLLTPKMIRVEPVKKSKTWNGKVKTYLVYAKDAVLLDGPDIFMYVLKHGGEAV